MLQKLIIESVVLFVIQYTHLLQIQYWIGFPIKYLISIEQMLILNHVLTKRVIDLYTFSSWLHKII